MKKSALKLVPDALPSLIKTIKRSYSPDPDSFECLNMDGLKTKKLSIKNETTIIPPLNFKRKVSIGQNDLPKSKDIRDSADTRDSEETCVT